MRLESCELAQARVRGAILRGGVDGLKKEDADCIERVRGAILREGVNRLKKEGTDCRGEGSPLLSRESREEGIGSGRGEEGRGVHNSEREENGGWMQ